MPLAPWTLWQHDLVSDAPRNLNDTIREERRKLEGLPTKYLPFLTSLRDNIRRLTEERLALPHHRVWRVHHERLVAEIEERIRELENRTDLAEFEQNIQPFVIAHASALGDTAEGAAAEGAQGASATQGVNGLTTSLSPIPAPTSSSSEVARVPELPSSVIDAMSTVQQKLYRRVMEMVRRQAARDGGSGGGEGGAGAASSPEAAAENLVRQLYTRLWVSSHAPATSASSIHDMCQRCAIPLTKSAREQMLVCSRCGFSIAYLDATENSRTYGEDVEYGPSASHRGNHFQEFVTRAQAREVTPVPRGILTKVAVGLRDMEKITRSEDVDLNAVVKVVNALNLRDYKRHVVQITARLSGKWPVQLTADQMFMAKAIFYDILNAFEMLFPQEKLCRNKYVLAVICFTMGWEGMLRTLDAIECSGAVDYDEEGAGVTTATSLSGGTTSTTTIGQQRSESTAAGTAPSLSVPATTVTAASPPGYAILHNIPRAEIEQSESRMRAIFKYLGWVFRGPFSGFLPEDELQAAQ